MPGFENAFLVARTTWACAKTRRIVGDYMITIEDIRKNSRFDDVVALNCRALDYHLKGTVFKIEMPKGNHDVPLRALTPGSTQPRGRRRCISCDHLSQASLRGAANVPGHRPCGGLAAASPAKADGNIKGQDIGALQRALIAQGAILGTGSKAEKWNSPSSRT